MTDFEKGSEVFLNCLEFFVNALIGWAIISLNEHYFWSLFCEQLTRPTEFYLRSLLVLLASALADLGLVEGMGDHGYSNPHIALVGS